MNSKNYPKQILELLDSKSNCGLTAREIANSILINEDMEINLKYIRQNLTRLRKRQKIYVQDVNEDNEYVYCSVTWLIKIFEGVGLESSRERERNEAQVKGMKYILELLGYVKKEELTYEINESNWKQIAKEKYGIGV